LRLAAMTAPTSSAIVLATKSIRPAKEARPMEQTLIPELDLDPRADEDLRVHEWRAERLRELGLPPRIAERFADLVDWHALAALVERGCPAHLALEIVR
jgi:hypothetical protein